VSWSPQWKIMGRDFHHQYRLTHQCSSSVDQFPSLFCLEAISNQIRNYLKNPFMSLINVLKRPVRLQKCSFGEYFPSWVATESFFFRLTSQITVMEKTKTLISPFRNEWLPVDLHYAFFSSSISKNRHLKWILLIILWFRHQPFRKGASLLWFVE